MITAKPCPFCGGSKIATQEGTTFRWRYAYCEECGAQGPEVRVDTLSTDRPAAEAEASRKAIEVWNERKP